MDRIMFGTDKKCKQKCIINNPYLHKYSNCTIPLPKKTVGLL